MFSGGNNGATGKPPQRISASPPRPEGRGAARKFDDEMELRNSLLITFVGSFIAIAFVYYLLDLSSGFLALGPNGNKEPFFFQVMDFLDRVGGYFTGVPFHKRNVGRAILFYATIFSLEITFLDNKRMQNQKKDRK